MSEVALVAAVTGASSVLTSGITALVTWRVSQNSSSIELAKVGAENERLQHGNREDERRNRQSTYHEFIDSYRQVFQILGTRTPKDVRHAACDKFNHLLGGVLLFGPTSVRDKAYALNEVYEEIWPALRKEITDKPDKPYVDCWHDATAPLKDKFGVRGSQLVPVMHADVTRGIVEEPN